MGRGYRWRGVFSLVVALLFLADCGFAGILKFLLFNLAQIHALAYFFCQPCFIADDGGGQVFFRQRLPRFRR